MVIARRLYARYINYKHCAISVGWQFLAVFMSVEMTCLGLAETGVLVDVDAQHHALLMAEWFAIGVDHVPSKIELCKVESHDAESDFGAIVDLGLIEFLSLVEQLTELAIMGHLVVAKIELIVQFEPSPSHDELCGQTVAEVE